MTTPPPAAPRATTPTAALGRPRAPRCFNPRSKQRFILDRWRQLVRHLGRVPSYPERLIIDRVVAIEYELRRLDAKVDAGEELSGHALRARLAAENRLRLDLQALGLKPADPAAAPGAALARHRAMLAAMPPEAADGEDDAA